MLDQLIIFFASIIYVCLFFYLLFFHLNLYNSRIKLCSESLFYHTTINLHFLKTDLSFTKIYDTINISFLRILFVVSFPVTDSQNASRQHFLYAVFLLFCLSLMINIFFSIRYVIVSKARCNNQCA